ncbi:MAG TPA: FMN-binding negative transcriptional regulator [Burkholderiaceae bacterium]|nr:FMN-binding negative transcriptional regulator [Burkholderiaceae bacterium]
MYIPAHFDETRLEVLHGLIRAQPFATVATLSSDGINANHIRLHLDADQGPLGTLRGHVARANPMWSDRVADTDALAIFQGPHTYISPTFYPTKREHGKVVPTWNYAVVHARGPLRVIDDPAWLRTQLEALVTRHEAASPAPWSIADAPPDFIDRMLQSIVGFEIVISKLSGKWKMSQNQPAANRAGVVEGLRQRAGAADIEIAQLVEEASRHAR